MERRSFGGGNRRGGFGGNRGGGGFGGNRGGGGGFGHFDDKPKPVKVGGEYDVEIKDVGAKGDGITKIENFIVFVANAKKGEKCRIRVKEVASKFAIAEKIGEASGEEASETPEESEETNEETEEENKETEEENKE